MGTSCANEKAGCHIHVGQRFTFAIAGNAFERNQNWNLSRKCEWEDEQNSENQQCHQSPRN
jgi:hypothetical protein